MRLADPAQLRVRITQRGNVTGVRFGIGPRIHYRIHANQGWILVVTLRAVVPLPPEAIEIGVVHPEDWIGCRGTGV